MVGNLVVDQKIAGTDLLLNVAGHFDENATLPSIDTNKIKSVSVDANKLLSINSVGVRTWIRWLNEYGEKIDFTYMNCPKIMVDQMNVVASMVRPGLKIKSFYVPYFCGSCNESFNVLFAEGKEFAGDKVQAPASVKCPTCGQNAEIDVIEKTYFRFLTTIKR
jgi:DNA-directed RNA polymerase subunit RPC12/RpoP